MFKNEDSFLYLIYIISGIPYFFFTCNVNKKKTLGCDVLEARLCSTSKLPRFLKLFLKSTYNDFKIK